MQYPGSVSRKIVRYRLDKLRASAARDLRAPGHILVGLLYLALRDLKSRLVVLRSNDRWLSKEGTNAVQ